MIFEISEHHNACDTIKAAAAAERTAINVADIEILDLAQDARGSARGRTLVRCVGCFGVRACVGARKRWKSHRRRSLWLSSPTSWGWGFASFGEGWQAASHSLAAR